MSATMAEAAKLSVDGKNETASNNGSLDGAFSSDDVEDSNSVAQHRQMMENSEDDNNGSDGSSLGLQNMGFERPQQQNSSSSLVVVEESKRLAASPIPNGTSGTFFETQQEHHANLHNDHTEQKPMENLSIMTKRSTPFSKQQQQQPNQQQDVIDLLDSSDEEEAMASTSASAVVARSKKPRLSINAGAASAPAVASYQARALHMPNWMKQNNGSFSLTTPDMRPLDRGNTTQPPQHQQQQIVADQPEYLPFPSGFQPTWSQMTPQSRKSSPPAPQPSSHATQPLKKLYRLSLLNVHEFTIEGLSPQWNMPPSSISGLRVPIRQISRKHGKSVYEFDRDENGTRTGGKWRIPLGAYHEFAAYLRSDPYTRIIGIPPNQLQIASLERARKEKGYPSPQELIQYGVPAGLAKALAPFQRGGVEFVKEKGGRALIADDMGLGKTIQGVASMSMYFNEWPLLVLCPSGARYHWENEFKQWLGVHSSVNRKTEGDDENAPVSNENLLEDWQIHVLTSSKSEVIPDKETKVVICSYGLAPSLIDSDRIYPGQFRCAIVDESHMLKNKASKRTSTLLPVLCAMNRCVLLSGTPALARPLELWPQLAILRTESYGWGEDEQSFVDKYVKNGNASTSAELHTLLTGTVMIRRLKNDILKTLPRKNREKAELHVLNQQKHRDEFNSLMMQLRQSKGTLGNLARIHHAEASQFQEDNVDESGLSFQSSQAAVVSQDNDDVPAMDAMQESANDERKAVVDSLNLEAEQMMADGRNRIRRSIQMQATHLLPEQRENVMTQMEGKLRNDVENYYSDKMNQINAAYPNQNQMTTSEQDEASKRTTLLSRLYGFTGEVKIPLVVDMLSRWLADPTKGKICIFAHHISVLDSIRDGAGLSNVADSNRKFIRIDGSTLPRQRQDQVTAFQTDPSIRVALLGITAAGVAVTLTASSTVWFAELFWTPAIMIQAEDRVHRIGQSSKVECLYFVARGTLDDILWKLIEKKFEDLGEFIEGKAKEKIVVNKTYKYIKELHASIFPDLAGFEEDEEDGDEDVDLNDVIPLDAAFYHDIEEFGEEEQRMLQQLEIDENEVSTSLSHTEVKMKAGTTLVNGQCEDDAIDLLDDDDDDEEEDGKGHADKQSSSSLASVNNVKISEEKKANMTEIEPIVDNSQVEVPPRNTDDIFTDCKLYKIVFCQPKLGIEVLLHEGRVVVSRVSEERLCRLGADSKPAIGDILVSIAGFNLSLTGQLDQYATYLKYVLQKPPVELCFLEAPVFAARFRDILEEKGVYKILPPKSPPPTVNGDGDTIEIIDDD